MLHNHHSLASSTVRRMVRRESPNMALLYIKIFSFALTWLRKHLYLLLFYILISLRVLLVYGRAWLYILFLF